MPNFDGTGPNVNGSRQGNGIGRQSRKGRGACRGEHSQEQGDSRRMGIGPIQGQVRGPGRGRGRCVKPTQRQTNE